MEDLIYRAKLAEQADRYEDMVSLMKSVVKQSPELTVDQRNLLSVGYKNVVGTRRTAWRTLSALESKEEKKGNTKNAELARLYREKVETEMNNVCAEILSLIDEILNSKRNTVDSKVFFLKMKGDYYRYEAEYQTAGANRTKYGNTAAENAQRSYQEATDIAADELPPTNPIKLGLALNYSVFFYEVKSEPETACNMARQAFDHAIAELDNLDEDQYKDSTTIMQLIRDNLTLWNTELQESGGAKADLEVEDVR
mmetsp:Transcript_14870/g.27497  ORF Transcript_14870/g.27497 Transcript_14870/m.27497 type:complete len:254 (-) Transcript_14870:48-809(-)